MSSVTTISNTVLPIFPGGSEAPQQDFSDGLMEVFCLASSLHIAQLQVGLGEPIRLGQCSSLKVGYGSDCSSGDDKSANDGGDNGPVITAIIKGLRAVNVIIS